MLDSLEVNRTLTIRYAVALGLIAVLSTAAFILMEVQLAAKKTHAHLINVSGRQTMLSLHISLDAGELYFGRTQEERALARLRMTGHIEQMRQAHRRLTNGGGGLGSPEEMTPEIAKAYFGAPGQEMEGLDYQVVAYLDLANDVLMGELSREEARDALDVMSANATGPLLVGLNAMADRYEAHANEALSNVANVHRMVFAAMGLLLFFEVLFIFRPLVRRLSRQAGDLRRMAGDLAQALRELGAMKDEMEGMVAAVAQDLRVPSNAIRGLADWLADSLDGEIDEVQHGLLVRLRERSHRFERLLRDLVEVCRDVEPASEAATLDLETVRDSVLTDIYAPGGFTVRFEGRLPGGVHEIRPLVVVLRQLIGTMLRGHSGEEGTIEVILGWRGSEAAGDLTVLAEIVDDDPRAIHKLPVLDDDQDVTEATAHRAELGLSLVRKIVRARSGQFQVEPNDDGTAQVRLAWPMTAHRQIDPRAKMVQVLGRIDEAMLRTASEIGQRARETQLATWGPKAPRRGFSPRQSLQARIAS